MEGLREARPLLLRSLRPHEVLNDVDQTRNVHVCSETPHGIRRQVVLELGVLVGMQEATVSNQQAQDPAVACALFAGLLGPLAPACLRLPVLDTHLDAPPQGLALAHIERAPGEV